MRKERKHYTAEEKVAILRRHLLDKVPVSDQCEEQALQPTVFYRWQKEFFENGAAAFQTPERPRFRPALVGEDRDQRRPIHCLARR
jgi:transposase